jgi:hypothetical protein
VKPEFWHDALTGELPADVALFYVGLWCAADDAGRFEADPRLLRAQLDPFDAKFGGPGALAELLDRLAALGRVVLYEVDGRRYGFVPTFSRHQHPNRPSPSRLPEPQPASLREDSGRTHAALTPGEDRRGSGSDSRGEDCTEPSATVPPPALTLPCVGKGLKDYPVTEAQLAEWRAAYPGVDVAGELRRARAWLVANKTKRKTYRGVPAFLVRWLGKAQDGGPGRRNGAPSTMRPTDDAAFADPADPRHRFDFGGGS